MATNYPQCKNIPKPLFDYKLTKDVADTVSKDYRTPPLFQKDVYEYSFKKHVSLQNNKLLQCRWREYKKTCSGRVFAPFEFVDIRDYHFYNYRNHLNPSLSIHKKGDFRMNLKPGPGVDFRGQIPIPVELLMKRGIETPRKLSKVDKKEEEKEAESR